MELVCRVYSAAFQVMVYLLLLSISEKFLGVPLDENASPRWYIARDIPKDYRQMVISYTNCGRRVMKACRLRDMSLLIGKELE